MIYVLDEMTVKPGMLQQYQEAFAREYVPGAEARGMRLVGSWTTPPLELDGDPHGDCDSRGRGVRRSAARRDCFMVGRTAAAPRRE